VRKASREQKDPGLFSEPRTHWLLTSSGPETFLNKKIGTRDEKGLRKPGDDPPTKAKATLVSDAGETMLNLIHKSEPDRSRINMGDEAEVKSWTKHLGVTKKDLERAVAKVGNSAATVRKELGKGG
jgi:hypothetical protein